MRAEAGAEETTRDEAGAGAMAFPSFEIFSSNFMCLL